MFRHCTLILVLVSCGDDVSSVIDAPVAIDAIDAPTTAAITIPFAARVHGEAFVCGQAYPNIGRTFATYTGIDFRFYVHGVTLVTPNGDVPVMLDVNEFQSADGIALLDFETGGACQMGTTATHTELTGTVPAGTTYTGLKLVIGVPFEKNHLDAALAAAPLNVPAMYWAWSSGYKFLKIDGTVNGNGFNLHLGSTGCNASGSTPPTSPCTSPNVVPITLSGVTPASTIVADVARLLVDADITTNTMNTAPGCMSFPGDPECTTVIPKLELPYGATPAAPNQLFLTVE